MTKRIGDDGVKGRKAKGGIMDIWELTEEFKVQKFKVLLKRVYSYKLNL